MCLMATIQEDTGTPAVNFAAVNYGTVKATDGPQSPAGWAACSLIAQSRASIRHAVARGGEAKSVSDPLSSERQVFWWVTGRFRRAAA